MFPTGCRIGNPVYRCIFSGSLLAGDLEGEYVNNEIADAPGLRLFFMDAEVRYSLPRWEVALRCENICDKHTYAFSSYDGVNTFSTSYALRRRAVLVSLGFKL